MLMEKLFQISWISGEKMEMSKEKNAKDSRKQYTECAHRDV